MIRKIKLLPIFIICAFLMLSIKVGNILTSDFSFSVQQNKAISQEVEKKEVVNIGLGDSFSKAEVEILQDLAKRREVLDVKSKELDKRSFELNVAKEDMDKKIEQMKVYEKRLLELVNKYNEQEKEKMNNLVKVYISMKPKDAAEIFNNLDMEVLEMLLSLMKPSSSSAILSQMNPNIAKEITMRIVGNNIK
ncbi:MAG: hypothetical protein R3Y43_01105 [Alphaproteobacteria bacterium]